MNQRLQQFLSAENISQSQFADNIGVARASVSHILAGRNRPGFEFIENMARHYPSLNLEWLITGKGRMYKDPSSSIPSTSVQEARGENSGMLFPNDIEPNSLPVNPLSNQNPVSDVSATAQTVQPPVHSAQTVQSAQTFQSAQAEHPARPSQPAVNRNISATGRTIAKIIVFFDDNTYQELI